MGGRTLEPHEQEMGVHRASGPRGLRSTHSLSFVPMLSIRSNVRPSPFVQGRHAVHGDGGWTSVDRHGQAWTSFWGHGG
jgi:hypothetical protein